MAYIAIHLILHKSIRRVWRLPEKLAGCAIVKTVNVLITFTLIVIGFAIFRAPSLETVSTMATQIFTDFHASVAPQFVEGYLLICAAIALSLVAHFSPKSWTMGAVRAYNALPVILQASVLALILFLVIQTRQSELVPFIYLQY